MTALLASEGGWQDFTLRGGEWLVLALSGAASLLAIAVGFYLAKSVLAEDEGTPKMKEIATAIQVGAMAYLKRQFRTIGMILIPVAIIVFVTSVSIERKDGTEALSFIASGVFRTLAFLLGCRCSTSTK